MPEEARDNFSRTTTDTLAKRAGFLCSNPGCRRSTIGPNTITTKSTSIGVAAHITAAAQGGPRFNPKLTSDQRSDISNGIWLCSVCATLIDKDPIKYTVALLYEWKGGIEAESRMKISGIYKTENISPKGTVPYNPILEVDFTGQGRGRFNGGYSMKNPIEIHNGQRIMVPGAKPIIFWNLTWRYKLMIYNNSNFAAYNVKIENISDINFKEFEKLSKINNIEPLGNKELKIVYEDMVEGPHTDADELLKPRYPEKFNNNLKLKLTYYDEERNEHISLVEFNNGEIINRKVAPNLS